MATPLISFDGTEFDKIKNDPDAYIGRLDKPYQLKRALEICRKFDRSGVYVSKVQDRARDLGIILNAVTSRNAVVAKALNACGTARNASGHKVKVTIKSITDKGIQTFEKIVDVDGLESWMRSAGLGGEYQHVLKQLAAMGVNKVSLSAMSKVMIADV